MYNRHKVLVSAAGPRMAPLLDVAAPTFQRFARRHGYDLLLDRELDDAAGDRDGRARARARWHKPGLLRTLVPAYDLVVWIDADAVILRADRDIAEDLPRDCFQGLVLETFPDRRNPNTGVWVLRGGSDAGAFLDAVLGLGQLDHSWADQATVCRLLGWELGDRHGAGARPARPSGYLAGTAWLPADWNRVRPSETARIRHFAGMALPTRLEAMRRVVAQGCETPAPWESGTGGTAKGATVITGWPGPARHPARPVSR